MPATFHNQLTETAVLLIKTTHKDHARTVAALSGSRTSTTRTRLGVHNSLGNQRHACLFRMVSIAEAFVDIVLETSLRQLVAATTPTAETLMSMAMVKLDTWAGRSDFANMFDLPAVNKHTKWSQVRAATDARNSIAHGLGSLTRKQDAGTKRTLEQIKIRVVDRALVVDEAALVAVRDLMVDFVGKVDGDYGSLHI